MSSPDMARAQSLVIPNPFSLSIAGAGSTASNAFTVTTTPPTTISSITIGTIATSGSSGNWLCATSSGAVITYSAGIGCSTTTTQLSAGTYNGNIPFTTNTGLSGAMTVVLTVGSSGGSGGFTWTPNPVTFNPVGTTFSTLNVNILQNGVAPTISTVSATTTTGQTWLSATNTGVAGLVQVNANSNGLSGSYSGMVFVTTTTGASFSFPVTLTANGSSSGLVASPNPVQFNLAAGSGSSSLPVNITFNGALVSSTSIVSAFTNTGQNWLSVFNSGTPGIVTVSVNPQLFSGVSDTGNVNVIAFSGSTSLGQVTFQVTLGITSGGSVGLVASPNPVNLNVSFAGSTATQPLTIFYNGSPTPLNNVTVFTSTGQTWLQAFPSGSTGGITVNAINTSGLFGGYSGTVTASTAFGSVTVPVNLTVGTGSGGSSGLVATPNVLNFSVPLVGAGATPTSQTVTITFNGALISVDSIASSLVGLNWLIIRSGGAGIITVSVSGAALGLGTQTATVTASTSSGDVSFQVNVTVGGGTTSGLAATPNPVNLSVQSAGGSATQTVNITSNSLPATVTGVTATTTTGQNWLIPSTGATAGTVTVGLNTSILQNGSYTGTVNVTTTAGSVPFTVNLTVGSGSTAGLSVNPNPLILSVATGGSFTQQNVNATFNGAPVLITGVTASTTTGQNWLTPSFSASVAGTVTVSVNTSILQAGSYSGTVTVSTVSGQTSFQVSLTVGGTGGGGTPGLSASPNPVAFNVALGQNPSQVITVTLNGAAAAVTSTTFVNIPVLSPTFVNTAINADGTVTLTVNNVITTPGNYQGTITLFTASGNISVPVTMTLGTGGGSSGLAANPNPVNFTVQPGASNAQSVNITFNGFPVAISGVTASTTTGQNWLLPSFSAAVSGSVNVAVSATGLNSATYTGTVTVSTTSGTLSFQVNLNVGGTTGPGSPTVTVSPSSLAPVSFQIGGSSPQPQSLTVSLVGGGTGSYSALATTTSGGAWLTVAPANGTIPGNVTVTVNPAATGPTPGTYQGTISITVPLATNSPLTLPITLTVTPAPVTTPTVVAIQNAGSTLPTSISPGLNILIFGSNMGPATLTLLQVGSNGTLATVVSGTQVTFDGVAAPIIFTSNNEVSVMVPYAVAGRASTSMVVAYNGVSSNPINLRVVDSAPSIYTLNQSGSGPGAILNQNGTVNTATNPEVAGNIIQIFGTGEGTTTPAGVDGTVLPNRLPLPRPNLPVTVTIGGIDVPAADVTYAGEAPGALSGVIQVNARIPLGVGTGPVSVVIKVGGVPSQNNVTVSVR